MSSHYTTEPPPTASVLLHTTAGPIQISLFATQTPLASRSFLQHVLDGYFNSTTFHRVVPGFVIQGGDPTGTGEGGESIYEDREFEIDAKTGEKVVFGDELHSRLRFNRRGLVGMAKMGESTYGSQFFITLADVRAQLDGNCTMFGRVEGDGIYNVVRIAEAENVEGTERPMYPFKITGAKVLEMPKGEQWADMKKRERVAKRTAPDEYESKGKKKAKTKKKGKTLLSFGGDEADEDTGAAIQPKAKFNTSLISNTANKEAIAADGQLKLDGEKTKAHPSERRSETVRNKGKPEEAAREKKKPIRQRSSPTPPPPRSPSHHSKLASKPPETHRRKFSFHDPTTQLPLKDPESPFQSPTRSGTASPQQPSGTSTLQAEIAALKASMRRTVPTAPETSRKKSALEQMIPETSIRGRKRPRPGAGNNSSSSSSNNNNNDSSALKILHAFKARLEGAGLQADASTHDSSKGKTNGVNGISNPRVTTAPAKQEDTADADEEATLCDLHFIANCQSCSKWDNLLDPTITNLDQASNLDDNDDGVETDWMAHALSFEKDRLGKDLSWKRKNEEELVVIDPREKEREIRGSGAKRGMGREREWGGRGR